MPCKYFATVMANLANKFTICFIVDHEWEREPLLSWEVHTNPTERVRFVSCLSLIYPSGSRVVVPHLYPIYRASKNFNCNVLQCLTEITHNNSP